MKKIIAMTAIFLVIFRTTHWNTRWSGALCRLRFKFESDMSGHQSQSTCICLLETQWKGKKLPNYLSRLFDFFYQWGRQLKSRKNEGICGSTERSEVLLDVLHVMPTLQLAPETVNKSCCKAGFEVGIGLCSPLPTNNYSPLLEGSNFGFTAGNLRTSSSTSLRSVLPQMSSFCWLFNCLPQCKKKSSSRAG